MGIKSYNPYTPSRRNMTGSDFSEITKSTPEKSLLASKKKTAGRNNQGKITVRHHGGGNRQKYRLIDFKRNKEGVPAKVIGIEYDPNRTLPTGTEKADIDRVFKTFKEYYSVHCEDKTKPYENIIEIIKKLRAENCHIAVVSNKADYAVQKLCERYFPNLIDIAVGERENVRKKPAPDSVLEVLKKLNADKSTAVYIGDSEVDIQTAKNADMDSIIVTWGFREKAYLLENGAKLTIDEPIDILNI